MSVTTFRIQPDNEEQLALLAEKLQRSKSWVINEALRDYIVHQDTEQARWRETLQAMESVAQGKIVQADAVHEWLQSWGSTHELPPPKTGE